MSDFPTFLINQPCVILGSNLPAGIYDKYGNCIIKIPWNLKITRPDIDFTPTPPLHGTDKLNECIC